MKTFKFKYSSEIHAPEKVNEMFRKDNEIRQKDPAKMYENFTAIVIPEYHNIFLSENSVQMTSQICYFIMSFIILPYVTIFILYFCRVVLYLIANYY